MSWGEIVGLTLTAALVGGVISGVLGALIARGGATRAENREHATQAYARWLAARFVFSRTSASFVAAFRALAAERRDSAQFPLQLEEAQRSRALWCEASRDLDFAEALLITSIRDPALEQRLRGFERVTSEALRGTVQADARSMESLLQELRASDQRAIDFVRRAAANSRGNQLPWYTSLARLTLPVRRIVDRWSRG